LHGEDRVIVPSPSVATYDETPAMNAAGIAKESIKAIESKQYGFLAVNFANGDMLGHTSIQSPIIESSQGLDNEVGKLLDVAQKNGD